MHAADAVGHAGFTRATRRKYVLCPVQLMAGPNGAHGAISHALVGSHRQKYETLPMIG